MRLGFTKAAIADVDSIRDFIATHDLNAALRVVEQIARTIRLLGEYPRLGHAGCVAGTLEMTVPGLPYVIVYELSIGQEDEFVVLRVYHAARDRS